MATMASEKARMEDLRAADWYSGRMSPPLLGASAGRLRDGGYIFRKCDEIGADLWRFFGPSATVLFAADRPHLHPAGPGPPHRCLRDRLATRNVRRNGKPTAVPAGPYIGVSA